LRIAFRRNLPMWKHAYKRDTQNSGTWRSECVFVPEARVWAAVREAMRGIYAGAVS